MEYSDINGWVKHRFFCSSSTEHSNSISSFTVFNKSTKCIESPAVINTRIFEIAFSNGLTRYKRIPNCKCTRFKIRDMPKTTDFI